MPEHIDNSPDFGIDEPTGEDIRKFIDGLPEEVLPKNLKELAKREIVYPAIHDKLLSLYKLDRSFRFESLALRKDLNQIAEGEPKKE